MQMQFLAQGINLAHEANQRGDFQSAIARCKQVLDVAPDIPEAWFNLGLAQLGLEEHKQATYSLQQAAVRTLNSAEAQNSIGLALVEAGATAEAEQCLLRSLKLAPTYSYAWSNLGKLREKQKRLKDAEMAFNKAIEIQPDLAPAYANLCGILNSQKKYQAAVVVGRKSIELNPQVAGAWSNLGSSLNGLGNYDMAEVAYRKAIALNPEMSEAWSKLGVTHSLKKQYSEAAECFERSLRLNPRGEYVLGHLQSSRMQICDWSSFDDNVKQILRSIALHEKVCEPFTVLGLTSDLLMQHKAAEISAADDYPEQVVLGRIDKHPDSGRIHVGYFSADFRNHPVSHLIAEVLELHDHSKLRITGFAFGMDSKDEVRQRISVAFDQFIDVRDKTDKQVAELARAMGVDIAIDLGGFTTDCRPNIFAMRAAPVQVSYLGYVGTMGAPYIDYILADKVIIPEESRPYYSEKVAYLPSYQANDATRQIPQRTFTRQEFGLPSKGFVFCCLNSNYKITPHTFDGWMRILRRVEGSVLLLYAGNDAVISNLKREAELRGVASHRLVFGGWLPVSENLVRYHAADLFLDTLPYNAGATASDALWAGLPVLTCMGPSFASRMAASLLTAIDIPELITTSQEEYEDLAVALATCPEQLALVKQKLEKNRLQSKLFDTRLFTRRLEAAYTEMHKRSQTDLPLDHIYID